MKPASINFLTKQYGKRLLESITDSKQIARTVPARVVSAAPSVFRARCFQVPVKGPRDAETLKSPLGPRRTRLVVRSVFELVFGSLYGILRRLNLQVVRFLLTNLGLFRYFLAI